MSDINGMSFLYGYAQYKHGGLTQWYSTSSANMNGSPPFTFGACFVMGYSPIGRSANLGVVGNWDANAGWGIVVDDDWQDALTNQEINVLIGSTTLTVGLAGGTGDKISSGVNRVCFVICRCNADGDEADLWFNGQQVDTANPTCVASSDDVLLGNIDDGSHDAFEVGGINSVFYTNTALNDIELVSLYRNLMADGRLRETLFEPEALYPNTPGQPGYDDDNYTVPISIDYLWQAYHLRDPYTCRPAIPAAAADFKAWTSHGAAATAKDFVAIDTLASLYMSYQSRVEWAGIVPGHQDPQ